MVAGGDVIDGGREGAGVLARRTELPDRAPPLSSNFTRALP